MVAMSSAAEIPLPLMSPTAESSRSEQGQEIVVVAAPPPSSPGSRNRTLSDASCDLVREDWS
jgi:hypothetical protein